MRTNPAVTALNADIIINVVPKVLSDGSYACDVHIGDVILNAYTEGDALKLAEKLGKAIDKRTCNSVYITYDSASLLVRVTA
jgi:hypothetical protein